MLDRKKKERAKQILYDAGAYLQGHYVLTSGKHCESFINSAAINSRVNALWELGRMIAGQFRNDDIEVIAGPATGSIGIATMVAYWLNHKNPPLVVYTEEITDLDGHRSVVFRRGFGSVIAGKNILFVDDVVITGESCRQTVNLVKNNKIEEPQNIELAVLKDIALPGKPKGQAVFTPGEPKIINSPGIPVGAAVICNRGGCTAEFLGVPKMISLVEDPVQTWVNDLQIANCPLCSKHIPIDTKFGGGDRWVSIHGQPCGKLYQL